MQHVREVYAKQNINLTEDTVLDITMSYDGSWLTRGHSSHVGIGCVVDVLTGLCIDAYVLCTYCQACHTAQQSLSSKPAEYAAWVIQHLDECDKNFNGK